MENNIRSMYYMIMLRNLSDFERKIKENTLRNIHTQKDLYYISDSVLEANKSTQNQ